MKTFQFVEHGGLCVKIFHTMTNRDVLKAIRQEAMLTDFYLNKDAENYLKTLDNDDLFIDPCGEMDLYFDYVE